MTKLPLVVPRFVTLVMAVAACAAQAQSYPSKPVHIIVTETGSGGDGAARLIAPSLTASLGQQVVVENRGGHAVNSAGFVSKAVPDGYTLLIHGAVWLLPFIEDVAYDPVRDLVPITQLASVPNVLIVNSSIAANDVKALIALAKARPGQLNYASGPSGSTAHLTAELFKSMAGVNIVRVPYKGTAPAINGVLGGQVELMFTGAISVMTHVKSGRLKALAIGSAQPSALAPGLPTIADSGVPGFESVVIVGMLAPAKTPEAIIDRLYQATARSLSQPDVKQKFFSTGAEVVGSQPAEFAIVIKADMARWGKVIKDAGIKAD